MLAIGIKIYYHIDRSLFPLKMGCGSSVHSVAIGNTKSSPSSTPDNTTELLNESLCGHGNSDHDTEVSPTPHHSDTSDKCSSSSPLQTLGRRGTPSLQEDQVTVDNKRPFETCSRNSNQSRLAGQSQEKYCNDEKVGDCVSNTDDCEESGREFERMYHVDAETADTSSKSLQREYMYSNNPSVEHNYFTDSFHVENIFSVVDKKDSHCYHGLSSASLDVVDNQSTSTFTPQRNELVLNDVQFNWQETSSASQNPRQQNSNSATDIFINVQQHAPVYGCTSSGCYRIQQLQFQLGFITAITAQPM